MSSIIRLILFPLCRQGFTRVWVQGYREKISGHKLAALRRKHSMSQDDLAKVAGGSRGGWANLEIKASTATTPARFKRLAQVFGLSLDQLRVAIGADGYRRFIEIEVTDAIESAARTEGVSPEEWVRQLIADRVRPPRPDAVGIDVIGSGETQEARADPATGSAPTARKKPPPPARPGKPVRRRRKDLSHAR